MGKQQLIRGVFTVLTTLGLCAVAGLACANAAQDFAPASQEQSSYENQGGGGSKLSIPYHPNNVEAGTDDKTTHLSSTPSPIPSPSSSPLNSYSPFPSSPTLSSPSPLSIQSAPVSQIESNYQVSFNTAGGSPTPETQNPQSGQNAQRPADPTRQGFSFDGWFNGDVAYDFSQPVTSNLALTAHWTPVKGIWSMNPDHGSTQGGTEVTLTPPQPRGIRFTQISAGAYHNLALASDGSTWAWGLNGSGQLGNGQHATGNKNISYTDNNASKATPVKIQSPANIRFTKVSAGFYHSLALDDDGNAWAWGLNGTGQLGIGVDPGTSAASNFNNTADKDQPTKVVMPTGVHFTQISAGGVESLALDDQGRVWAWGLNNAGQLGTGAGDKNNPVQNKPVQIRIPDDSRIIAISTGWFHSLALDDQGRVWAWGLNGSGQIGNGKNGTSYMDGSVNAPTPTLSQLPNTVVIKRISAGAYYSLAIDNTGQAWAWGLNSSGALGNGAKGSKGIWDAESTSADTNKPVQVQSPIGTRFVQINATAYHTTAIDETGQAWAWGLNGSGQLGNGQSGSNYTDNSVSAAKPNKVEMPSNIHAVQIYAGYSHSIALGSDGQTYSWGYNASGQLGNGNTIQGGIWDNASGEQDTSHPNPVLFPEPARITGAKFDGIPSTTIPSRQADGTWRITSPAHPEGLVKLDVDWSMEGTRPTEQFDYRYLSATKHKVTFMTSEDSSAPPSQWVDDGGQAVRPVSDPARAGWLFDGWFLNEVAYDFADPVVSDMTLAAHWTKGDGSWSTDRKQGATTGGDNVILTPPAARGIKFSQVSGGDAFSLALGSDGALYSWGSNAKGQLGIGSAGSKDNSALRDTPTRVTAPQGVRFIAVSAGGLHSLALDSSGQAWAWGMDGSGQLGDGRNGSSTTDDSVKSTAPIKVQMPKGVRFTRIAAGYYHSLALDEQGGVWAWGLDGAGQLGDGHLGSDRDDNTVIAKVPTKVKSPTGVKFTQITAGAYHSLALDDTGKVWAWGLNGVGQLGNGENAGAVGLNSKSKSLPTRVSMDGNTRITQLATGAYHSLALDNTGQVWAWGLNSSGQLGMGTSASSIWDYTKASLSKPTAVKLSSDVTATRIASGYYHSTLEGTDGKWYTWGLDASGQLGDGRNSTSWRANDVITVSPSSPQTLAGHAFNRLEAGGYHTVGIGEDGELYAWGQNSSGQLGDKKHGDPSVWDDPSTYMNTPVKAIFPGEPKAESVTFGQTPSPGTPTDLHNGTWLVTTPLART